MTKEETEIGGLRRLPDRKGEPGQESEEGGGYSTQASGKVRKFVSIYEAKMKIKNKCLNSPELLS